MALDPNLIFDLDGTLANAQNLTVSNTFQASNAIINGNGVFQTPGGSLHDVLSDLNPAGAQHDKRCGIGSQVARFTDTAAGKQRHLVLHTDIDEIQIAIANTAGNRMAHVVHGDVIGRTGTTVFAVNCKTSSVGIAGQVV